jgi:hypothetical protein
VTGQTLSNDGETAIVKASNGERIYVCREECGASRETFLRDFEPGRECDFDIQYIGTIARFVQ